MFGEVTLYLCKSTIQPCMEYSCPVWVVVPSSHLDVVDKLQKLTYGTIGPKLAASLEGLPLH